MSNKKLKGKFLHASEQAGSLIVDYKRNGKRDVEDISLREKQARTIYVRADEYHLNKLEGVGFSTEDEQQKSEQYVRNWKAKWELYRDIILDFKIGKSKSIEKYWENSASKSQRARRHGKAQGSANKSRKKVTLIEAKEAVYKQHKKKNLKGERLTLCKEYLESNDIEGKPIYTPTQLNNSVAKYVEKIGNKELPTNKFT